MCINIYIYIYTHTYTYIILDNVDLTKTQLSLQALLSFIGDLPQGGRIVVYPGPILLVYRIVVYCIPWPNIIGIHSIINCDNSNIINDNIDKG